MTLFDYDRLHFETTGPADGPPVLLLHGWGSSAELMQPLARGLQDTYRVVNVDLPGHGLTPPPPEPWGVPEYADLVREVIEREMGGGPVPLVGHSNGGRIGMYLATTPELAPLLSKLVLVSPSGITPRRTWKYYLKKYTAKILKAPFLLLPEPLRGYGLDWLRHTFLWKLLGSSDYRSLDGVMREVFVKTVSFHLDEKVRDIRIPTLLFWGDQDTAVSRYQMDYLETNIPDAGLVVLDGAGHYGYLDAPDIVLGGTRHFLGKT